MASENQGETLMDESINTVHDVVTAPQMSLQKPGLSPGFAFCKFAPGVVETFIRGSLTVALLLLICIAAATIHKKEVVTDDYETSGLTITTGCIMFAASLLLIIELIMLLLRFLNPSHFNNNYTAYCRWGIAKCIMAVIGLFIMCFFEISFTRDELIESDCYTKRVEDRAKCKHGMKVYELALATTIITVICISLLLVLFVWDVIFLTYNFKSRIPVPRDYELIQQ